MDNFIDTLIHLCILRADSLGEKMMVLVLEDKCPHCKVPLEIIICEVGNRKVTVKACPTGAHFYTTLIKEKTPTEK